ncbi:MULTISPECIES: tetratricopeptide repeat protein [unclassified Janthinobacterium]|uniref:tetratricopeptide repeat protein n=1 Tax=unclassified Janthinobacterium TaxID=2610881 RepID=UPI000885F6FE|nr:MULTISPECIES: tetratricopeptide repeat protein [unclassified Janthinobacterium]SDA81058.1 Predicted O-linked N-acetylglucosamine transferase, SPINDLY family [Janthinobacterium sp. 551a]SFB65457.1 Predicted O-linked N-acetylglucosamine transferase, SPINDLY family [Janthinobacterium sp. 344]
MSTHTPEAVNLDAELQRAIEHHQAGRYAEAEALYLSIVQAQPYHAVANHNVGLLAGQLGFHEAALPYLRTALSVNPDEGQFWLSYATGLLSAQQAEHGLEIIESAIQRGLDNMESQALLARARAAVAQLPQTPTAEEMQHVVALYNAGQYAALESATRALVASYPASGFAWSVLGTALQLQGKDALPTLQKTVELAPHDAEAHGNLGNAWQAAGQYESAIDCYLRALEIQSDFAEAHSNLGSALQALERLDEAAHAYRQALAINPDYALAHFNLGNTLKSMGDLQGAVASYRSAAALAPDDAELHGNLGNALQALQQLDAAAASYRHAIALAPGYALAHSNLGTTLQDLQQLEAALASHEEAVRLDAGTAAFQNGLGLCLRAMERPQEALEAFQRAHRINPHELGIRTNLGSVLFALERKAEALEIYQALLEIDGENASHYNHLGLILHDLGRLDEAIATHRKGLALAPASGTALLHLAVALSSARDFDGAVDCHRQALALEPASADLHNRLGIALQKAKCYDEALLVYGQALTLESEHAVVHSNIGAVLHDMGRYEEALEQYEKAVALNPDFAAAHMNMGMAYRLLNLFDEAIAAFRQAISLRDDYLEAHTSLGATLCEKGLLEEAIISCRTALAIDPHCAPIYSNLLFCLTHLDYPDPAALFAEHQKFAEIFETPLHASWPRHGNAPDPERVLHIGFVSGDFNNHAVANFILPIFDHLSRSPRVVLHGYYTSLLDDDCTTRVRSLLHHWHAIHHLSDAALAAKIESDGIDILIDLAGHTGGNRLLAFAHKPAPVQASWIGYPGTTGLQAMDYFLCDRFYLPPGAMEEQFSEAIAYLPAAAPFLPSALSPPVKALPALQNGHITFGSFNRPNKLSREVIAAWARLLRALPSSRMLIGAMPKSGGYDTYIDWFAHEGVARTRLDFYPRTSTGDYLELHNKVDLCLDTFPYTGGTTTMHALWMGVPTLTIPGNTLPGRVTACALSHMGMAAFIANDIDDFVAKGSYIANDPALLSNIRANLRQIITNSPMGRSEIIAAGFEGALRAMWHRWCAGQAPASFEIELDPAQADGQA